MPGPAGSRAPPDRARGSERGQALVETALVVPLVLLLVFGVVAVGRLTQAQMAMSAVAREAARGGALANSAAEATQWGLARGQDVAVGYSLNNGTFELTVDPGGFERGGQVRAAARYQVVLDDLPLLHWVRVPLASSHAERIDLYRSRWSAEAGR